jgi:N-methylhydantoinase B
VLLRCLGLLAGVVAQAVDGRMPADQETIRYTGFYGTDADGKPFLSREVLGGGSGGRSYADGNDAIHIVPDSRNQPAEFTETRFPLLVEKLALRTDSGGAGKRRGGLGYEKHYRALVDCRTIVTADRVRLGCYGVNGGKAGEPFCVTVDVGGTPRDLAAWSTASRCGRAVGRALLRWRMGDFSRERSGQRTIEARHVAGGAR